MSYSNSSNTILTDIESVTYKFRHQPNNCHCRQLSTRSQCRYWQPADNGWSHVAQRRPNTICDGFVRCRNVQSLSMPWRRWVQAFVSSRLDYCNSALYGTTENLFWWLQSAAIKLIRPTRQSWREHIIPAVCPIDVIREVGGDGRSISRPRPDARKVNCQPEHRGGRRTWRTAWWMSSYPVKNRPILIQFGNGSRLRWPSRDQKDF